MKTTALAATALLSLLWPAEAAELTDARRSAVRALGETAALINICPKYEYDEDWQVELYAESRLPPSFLSSDADVSELYQAAQMETLLLVDELSNMVGVGRENVACSFAADYTGNSPKERVRLLRMTPEAALTAEAAKRAEQERLKMADANWIRGRAAPVARALMLMRSCNRLVINEVVFKDYAGSRSDEVRTAAVGLADAGGVANLPPAQDSCAVAEKEFGSGGTIIRDLAR